MSAALVTASPKNPNSGKAFAADASSNGTGYLLSRASKRSGFCSVSPQQTIRLSAGRAVRIGNESARHSLALMCGANLLLAAAPPRPGAVMALGASF